MKKFTFLLILCLLIYCKPKNEQSASKTDRLDDSVLVYYKLSKDKNLSLADRKKAINKSFSKLKTLPKDKLYGQVLHQKNLIHLTSKEYDSLMFYSNHLLSHSSEIDDNIVLAKHYYLLGYYFAEIAYDFNRAIENYNLSKEYYVRLKDSSQIGRNLLNIGIIQKNQNDFFGSKETLVDALRYLKDGGNIANCYNALATDHRKLLNFPDAINYYNKAIESTISEKDILIYQNNLATTYIDNEEYTLAISLLILISKDSLLISNQKEYARVLDNLAYAKWLSGIAIKENEFQAPFKIRVQNKDQRGQIASYTHLGEFNSKSNPARARAYFDSVIGLAKKLKIPRAEKDVLKYLMSLEPNNVNVRDRYVFLQDSLYEQELKVKTQFAKYKYDDKLKQESILSLEKEKVKQELEVVKQRSQKIRSYAIGSLLLLISGFVIYFFVQRSKRLKQLNKSARLEAAFETEAELSRKLHDDFGGKLNHAMLLLQSEANNGEVLNIVDGLYNQSRDFSREINDVDTGPNFKDFLFGMMGNYSKNTKLIVSGSTEVDWLMISPLSKKTLFKVLQELMINMQKHSDASLVSFAFEQTKKMLKVTYADDGTGASNEELNLKNGLWNTEKRIEAIGGTIIFDSEKGRGFEVQIGIPN